MQRVRNPWLAAPVLLHIAIVVSAAPRPAGHWRIDPPARSFKKQEPGSEATAGVEGTLRTHLNREAWAFRPGGKVGPLETPGDGWEALTVLADVYVRKPAGSYQAVICRDRWGGPKGDVFGLLLSPDGTWTARVRTVNGQATVTAPAAAGWHMPVMTYDGSVVRLFIDGRKVGEKAHTGALVSEPATPLTFGVYADGRNGLLTGALREARIWRKALDADAVTELTTAWRAEIKEGQTAGFWFAQAADTHALDTKSIEMVNRAVDAINADARVAFSLWLGDLTTSSTPDQMTLARLMLSRLSAPHYALRGNHDLKPGVFEKEFGTLRRKVTHGGWVFLLVDSNPGDKTPLSDTDQGWLTEQLETIDPETPVVLCTHHPLMPGTKALRLAGAEEVLALFSGHNLRACLSGHYHGNQEETIDGVLFTTTACLTPTRGNFDGTQVKGFRIFHCAAGAITTEFMPVE